jgi:hypothetical protein
MKSLSRSLRFPFVLGFLLLASLAAAAESKPVRVLFLGNSYLFGSGSSSRFFRPNTVTDLNQAKIGGVPALFKSFTQAAGLAYDVHLELASGQGFDYHLAKKSELIGQRWDLVVMQSFSLLDQAKPGDPALMIRSAKALGELFARFNSQVDIRLIATWPRADAVYPEAGHWHGKGIEGMARDVRAAYDQAAAVTPQVRGVIPVGESWLRAISTGFADGNPYDGIAFGQVSLWTHDYHHASNYGYYLEALMIFGHVTGLDPRSLGENDAAAFELGMAQEQAGALQKVAAEQLLAAGTKLAPFKSLTPAPKRRVE